MTSPTIAYKAFDKDLKCGGFQYAIGETHTHDGDVIACESGFHSCFSPFDCWNYYDLTDSRFALVEVSGETKKTRRSGPAAAPRRSGPAAASRRSGPAAAPRRSGPAATPRRSGPAAATRRSKRRAKIPSLHLLASTPKPRARLEHGSALLNFRTASASVLRRAALVKTDWSLTRSMSLKAGSWWPHDRPLSNPRHPHRRAPRPCQPGGVLMDVFGCQGKPTKIETVAFYFAIVGLFLCVFVGLPCIVLMALGVIG